MTAGSKKIYIDKYMINHNIFFCGIGTNTIGLYSGGSVVGNVIFVPKGQPVPPSKINETPFLFSLYYEIDRYPDIIETLRYEKPIYVLVIWDENNIVKQGSISTNPDELLACKKDRVCLPKALTFDLLLDARPAHGEAEGASQLAFTSPAGSDASNGAILGSVRYPRAQLHPEGH